MTITELIDHLTVIAKKNPNLIVYSCAPIEDVKPCKINPEYFQIGNVQQNSFYGDVIKACKIEEASDLLIQ
jgi:hypothetical protein